MMVLICFNMEYQHLRYPEWWIVQPAMFDSQRVYDLFPREKVVGFITFPAINLHLVRVFQTFSSQKRTFVQQFPAISHICA